MTQTNNIIYQTGATATGGRVGHVQSRDGHLSLDLSAPTEMGGPGGSGTNPEQLFAAGYAACFQSALEVIARRQKLELQGSTVTAQVGLARDGLGFALDVELQIQLPGIDHEAALKAVQAAHEVCPYSRATRGNVDVRLTVLD